MAHWQPDSDAGSMEAKVEAKDFDQLFYLQNKTPKWDEAHGGHVLNFQVCTQSPLPLHHNVIASAFTYSTIFILSHVHTL